MNLLLTTEFYYPSVCGVSIACQHIAEGLVRLGHSVTVATSRLEERHRTRNGVNIVGFDVRQNTLSGIKGEHKEYQRFLSEWRGELMLNYASQVWTTDLVFPLLEKLPYKKVLLPCGYSGLAQGLKERVYYYGYYRKLPRYLKRYDEFIFLSENYVDRQFHFQHDLKKGCVIGNGVNFDEINNPENIDFRSFYNIRSKYLLLCVSNHQRNKGHDFVIEAAFRAKRDDFMLVIIGNAQEGCFRKCLSYAKKNNEKLLLLTGLPRSHVISALKEADLFLYGSVLECFPLAIIEAMGCGLPYISTPCGNVPDLPGGVKVTKIDEMGRSINLLLDNVEMRKELGRAGLNECINKYNWERISREYERQFMRIINENGVNCFAETHS